MFLRHACRAFRPGVLTPYLFLAPALVVYIGFLVYPMLVSLYVSFFDWDGMAPTMTFVGFKNYFDIFFTDEVARLALLNNVFWTLGCLIIPTIGLCNRSPPAEPWKRALPKLKMPPSDATSQ